MARVASHTSPAVDAQRKCTDLLSVSGTGLAADQLIASSARDKFSILRAASASSLYASHAPGGLSHFVFGDNTFLVSFGWGAQFLAVTPEDPASWDAYLAWMAQREATEHLLVTGEIGVATMERDRPRPMLH